MNHIEKTILWTVALCVFGYLGIRILVLQAPSHALAQAPADVKGDGRVEFRVEPQAGLRLVVPLHREQVEAATQKLRLSESQSDQEQAAARAELRKLLVDIFTQDMETRNRQVQEIQLRLEKLRQQYTARESRKDEIIDLQLQVLEKNAAGLGFPTSPPGGDATEPNASHGIPFLHDHSPSSSPNSAGAASLGNLPYLNQSTIQPEPHEPNLPALPLNQLEPQKGPAVEEIQPGGNSPNSNDLKPLGELVTPALRSLSSGADSQGATISEYTELRARYLGATASLLAAENHFKSVVVESHKQMPGTTVDEVKQQHPEDWGAVERGRAGIVEANRVFEAKLTLLQLDLDAAEIAYNAAKTKFEELQKLVESRVATQSELREQRAVMESAGVAVQRAKTLLNLFASIKTATPPAVGSDSSGNRNSRE